MSRYAEARSKGLCGRLCGRVADDGRSVCFTCSEAVLRATLAYQRENIALGRCRLNRNHPLDRSGTYCRACQAKCNAASARTRERRRGHDVPKLKTGPVSK